ncbi:MAG: pseudouridine synthase [Desulfovibrio sp.]|nr:pseudouridine synthase [Desulfovibrio sp.]|tara:strand:- start:770 stop:1522 length:753 start_codon:yes stop_codon:yes gene_type:complete
MDNTKPIRLNKFIAQCGIASRRGADDLVFSGKVSVNGKLADSPGYKVDPTSDIVKVNNKTIGLQSTAQNITLMINKPIEVVTTASDPQGRTTVLDLLPEKFKKMRPFPVGRLDYFSEGLLLLTTDGDLCYRLTHPKFHLPKVYRVTVRGRVPDAVLKTMRSGMTLEDGEKLAPVLIDLKKYTDGKQILDMTLTQGVNRQIRRMFAESDITILKLRRTKQGPLNIGSLKPGKWRELSERELASLKKAVELA